MYILELHTNEVIHCITLILLELRLLFFALFLRLINVFVFINSSLLFLVLLCIDYSILLIRSPTDRHFKPMLLYLLFVFSQFPVWSSGKFLFILLSTYAKSCHSLQTYISFHLYSLLDPYPPQPQSVLLSWKSLQHFVHTMVVCYISVQSFSISFLTPSDDS